MQKVAGESNRQQEERVTLLLAKTVIYSLKDFAKGYMKIQKKARSIIHHDSNIIS